MVKITLLNINFRRNTLLLAKNLRLHITPYAALNFLLASRLTYRTDLAASAA
jgi:hypothetical protein